MNLPALQVRGTFEVLLFLDMLPGKYGLDFVGVRPSGEIVQISPCEVDVVCEDLGSYRVPHEWGGESHLVKMSDLHLLDSGFVLSPRGGFSDAIPLYDWKKKQDRTNERERRQRSEETHRAVLASRSQVRVVSDAAIEDFSSRFGFTVIRDSVR
jgi:hypothetical protein